VTDPVGAPPSRHDPERALELIREALRRPAPVSLERAAELLSSTTVDGIFIPARVDAAWPMARRGAGRPRKKSPWHRAYWRIFGQTKAREAAASANRQSGARFRDRVHAAVPELQSLRIPRRFWPRLIGEGTAKLLRDDLYIARLTHALRLRNYGGVRSALKRSKLPVKGVGDPARIHRALIDLGFPS
jgi:hypothetical protein